MATFLEEALGRRARAAQQQERPQPAPTPSFGEYRQMRAQALGNPDDWDDAVEDQVAGEYKQTYLPALASSMGLGPRPRQEQIDGLAIQFDQAHAKMKASKAAALGRAPATPGSAPAPTGEERTWTQALVTDPAARALRGAASIGPGLANAGIEALKMGSALAAGLGLISEEDAFSNMDAYRSIQDPLNQGAAEIRQGITQNMLSEGAQRQEQRMANAGFTESAWDMLTSPSKLIEQGVQMVGPGAIGAGLGRRLAVREAGQTAATGARLAGSTPEFVAAAREAAKEVARKGTAQTAKAATTGATAGMTAFAAGAGSASARERFANMIQDPAQMDRLLASEKYQEALQRNGGDHVAALEDLQDEAGMWSAATSAVINGLASKIPGIGETVQTGIAKWATPKIGAEAAEEFAKRTAEPLVTRITQAWNQPGSVLRQAYLQPRAVLGSTPVKSAAFEGMTEGAEQFAQNVALAKTGLAQDLWEGVAGAAGAGFAVGGALGGVMDAQNAIQRSREEAAKTPESPPQDQPDPAAVQPSEAGQPPTDPAARYAFDTGFAVDRTMEMRADIAAPVLESPTAAGIAGFLSTKIGRKGKTVLDDMEGSIKSMAKDARAAGVEYDATGARDAVIDTLATRTGVDPAAIRQAMLQATQSATAKPTAVPTTPDVAEVLRAIPGVEVTGSADKPVVNVSTRAALEAVRSNPAAANLDLAKAEEAITKRITDATAELEAFADSAVMSPKVRAAEAVGAQVDAAEVADATVAALSKSILKRSEEAAAALELGSAREAADMIIGRAAQQLAARIGGDPAQLTEALRQGVANRLSPPKPTPAPVAEPAPAPDPIEAEVERVAGTAQIRQMRLGVSRKTPEDAGKAIAASLRGKDPSDALLLATAERVATDLQLDPEDVLFATTQALYPPSAAKPVKPPVTKLGEKPAGAQKKRPDSVAPQRLAEVSAKARIDPEGLTELELQDLVIGRMEPVGGVARSDIKISDLPRTGKVGRMIKSLERVFGRRIVGLEIAGQNLGGFTFPRDHRVIFINPNAKNPVASVLAHEFAHTLEASNPKLKADLNRLIANALGEQGLAAYRSILDDAGRTGDDTYSTQQRDWVATSETLADFVSDALSDGRLLAELYAKDQGLFFEVVQKIREFLERVMQAIRGQETEVDTLGARYLVQDFAALKSQIEAAISSAAEAGPATRILGPTPGESQWVADATTLPNDPRNLPAFIKEQRREGADLVRQMNAAGQTSLEPEQDTRTRLQRVADGWFDTAGPWYRLRMESIKKGIRDVGNDVYEAMVRMIGEAGWNVKRDTEQVTQPMTTIMANAYQRLRSNTGVMANWNIKSERDFIRTLGMIRYAQHAPERNATGRWLASTLEEDAAADRADILARYQNGLMSKQEAMDEINDIMSDPDNVVRMNNAWSGLTDAQARSILDEARKDGLLPVVEEMNPYIKEATARTLGYQRDAGNFGTKAKRLIDLYGWTSYVPVKGTEFSKEVDASSTFRPEMYIANNFESEVRLTGGRSSALGAQIIGGVVGDMARAAYTLSTQNVAKTVERLVAAGGVPGAKTKRITQLDTDDKGRYLPITAVKGKDGSISYPTRGMVAYHGDYATEIELPDKNLITSLERQTRTLGALGRIGAKINQNLGRLLTGLNWNFWLGALTIDAQATGFALLMKHGPKVAGRYFLNLVKQGVFLKSMRLAFMTNTQLEKAAARDKGGFYDYAYQLKKRGGVAFFGDSLGDPKAKYSGMEAQMAAQVGRPKWRQALRGLPGGVANGLLSVGEGFELAPRVAAYRALVESGVDPREATATTKDFMDFNKTGTYGGTAAAAYLFFRPAATGAITTVRQILDTPNGRKVALGYAAASMMLYLATIGSMSPEERRKLSRDSIMRNVLLPDADGGFFQVPEAYGVQRLMGQFGRVIAMISQQDMTIQEGAFQMVSAIKENVSALPQTNVNPFRPGVDPAAEGWKLMVQLMPTMLRTFVQPAMNMTNQGTPLHIPDAWLGKRFAADSAKPNTPDVYSDLAKSLLEGTGEVIDVYPETIKYWADTLGVMGQTINAVSFAQIDADKAGQPLGVGDVLQSTFGKKFYNRDRQFTPSVRYQNLVAILDRQAKQYERAKDLGTPYTPEQMAAASKVRQLRSQYKRMNDAVRKMPDGPAKEARRAAISKWQESEVERYNQATGERM